MFHLILYIYCQNKGLQNVSVHYYIIILALSIMKCLLFLLIYGMTEMVTSTQSK